MATGDLKRTGYGQVEPNHLSAARTGQIYAQQPAASGIARLENGQFVKYDMANSEVNFTGDGEWLLVLNEVKLYNEQFQNYKDFAMVKTDAVNGVIVPRLYKTNVGDIITTNTFDSAATSNVAEVTASNIYVVGELVTPGSDGYLEHTASAGTAMCWKVVHVYTMPDGQPGVKLQRIQ